MKQLKNNLWVIFIFALMLCASGISSKSAAESSPGVLPKNQGVNIISKVAVTFHGDPGTARGFVWYTTQASVNSNLQVIAKTGASPDFSKALTFTGRYSVSTHAPSELVHKAEAIGLKPNTSYFFRVGDAALNLWSDYGTFQTADVRVYGQTCEQACEQFTFVDLTDTQASTENEALLSSGTITTALSTIKNARFLVFNGDLVDRGGIEKQWDRLFGYARKIMLNTTFVPCAGNHDADPNSFLEHFNVKPAPHSSTVTGVYYSFDYCNAHFIILNSNENSSEYADFTPAQIKWLQEDSKTAKAAGAEWLIVIMHKGPYTTSNHATDRDITGPNGVRTKVAPLLAELGIDLVLQGHDHIYARSKPIKNGKAVSAVRMIETANGKPVEYTVRPEGTVYLIPNTAGPKVYSKNQKIDPSYYHLFEVADEQHAAVSSPDSRRPVRGRIRNFVGITIQGNKLNAITYEIDRGKNNGQPYIIDQFGILKKAGRVSTEQKEDMIQKLAVQ